MKLTPRQARLMDDGPKAIRQLVEDQTQLVPNGNYAYTVEKKDGTEYFCDPYGNVCNCPAIKDCKHLRATRFLKMIVRVSDQKSTYG